MATLVSPGVDVQIIDESFYGSAGPGTVPLIVFATRANKASPTGTGIAPGTVPGTAQELYMVTSQRELVQTFGNPNFEVVQGTPVHGSELNEYGLHAAYQYLGISNRAYVMRADIDLSQLEPSVAAPRGEPLNGTYWFDVQDSEFGVFQSIGDASLDPFEKQPVTRITSLTDCDEDAFPLTSIGENGDFAIVVAESHNRLFERIDDVWYLVGSATWKYNRNIIRASDPMETIQLSSVLRINDVDVLFDNPTSGGVISATDAVNKINTTVSGSSSLAGKFNAKLDTAGRMIFNYTVDVALSTVSGNALAAMKITAGTYKSVILSCSPHTRVPQGSSRGDVWMKTTSPNGGAALVVKVYNSTTGQFTAVTAPLYATDLAAYNAFNGTVSVNQVYAQYNPEGTDVAALGGLVLKRWTGTAWDLLSYEASLDAPTTAPEEGTFWYNTNFQVDIMYGDGDQWIGYRNQFPNTDPHGVIIAGSAPLFQSDNTALVDNDIWLDSSDLENYPRLYRYTSSTKKWTPIDNTDQTTPFGIVFADARQDSGPTYDGAGTYGKLSTKEEDLNKSNFVDPDAPDPRTYPAGVLLFNTRFSTYNVKEWKPDYFKAGGFDENQDFEQNGYTIGLDTVVFPELGLGNGGRWVTASGNDVDGSPFMGRKAQRIMIVRALSAIYAGNEDIRSELVYFNLVACPGYPELIDEMVTLNTDSKEVAFVVGDTPARLTPAGIQTWATNKNNAASNGDKGLTTHNQYVGVYYPWGLSTNVDGTEIMVPPSTIALRTYAYNDQVAYPWFAPAGFTRGLVTNAASVGYLTSEGEYKPVILNPGQRDVLYTNNINPIAYIPNRGLVIYGQKTTSPVTSALDRVNVARLANYLKYNLDNLAKPFLFEPNDLQTRDAFKVTIERFLMGLVGLRALNDFAVVCDTTNNTNERIDRNELWADIYIQPVKAVEFIYLPVRIQNTGASN